MSSFAFVVLCIAAGTGSAIAMLVLTLVVGTIILALAGGGGQNADETLSSLALLLALTWFGATTGLLSLLRSKGRTKPSVTTSADAARISQPEWMAGVEAALQDVSKPHTATLGASPSPAVKPPVVSSPAGPSPVGLSPVGRPSEGFEPASGKNTASPTGIPFTESEIAAACALALLVVLFMASFTWEHVPLSVPIDPNQFGSLDQLFFFVGRFICEGTLKIGWGSFYVNFCSVGNLFVRLPNYMQVGQFALVGAALLAAGAIIRRNNR
jgi:hypothetical protein